MALEIRHVNTNPNSNPTEDTLPTIMYYEKENLMDLHVTEYLVNRLLHLQLGHVERLMVHTENHNIQTNDNTLELGNHCRMIEHFAMNIYSGDQSVKKSLDNIEYGILLSKLTSVFFLCGNKNADFHGLCRYNNSRVDGRDSLCLHNVQREDGNLKSEFNLILDLLQGEIDTQRSAMIIDVLIFLISNVQENFEDLWIPLVKSLNEPVSQKDGSNRSWLSRFLTIIHKSYIIESKVVQYQNKIKRIHLLLTDEHIGRTTLSKVLQKMKEEINYEKLTINFLILLRQKHKEFYDPINEYLKKLEVYENASFSMSLRGIKSFIGQGFSEIISGCDKHVNDWISNGMNINPIEDDSEGEEDAETDISLPSISLSISEHNEDVRTPNVPDSHGDNSMSSERYTRSAIRNRILNKRDSTARRISWGDNEGRSPVTNPSSETKKIKRFFTKEEEQNLLEGHSKYGNSWSTILKHYEFNDRTTVDLKDKMRNLRRKESRCK